ncbi:amino acid adenylation domain-containing protein [Aeromonas veronii]|uniref:amino acid adenylation domain-containing protein n=1 Tax=Aeromonas veronii TaxID=654 RepID=UPI003006B2E3
MEQTMAMRATQQRGEQPRWPLTTAQAGIWFAQQKYPQSPACNTGEYWLLEGALAPHHFARAVRQTIDEIPGLHCAFVATADGPQMVANPACWQLAERDLRSEADPLAAAQVEMRAQLAVPFNLAGGPLFATTLYRLGEGRWAWFIAVHHIAIDGFGLSLLCQRVANWYEALCVGEQPAPCHYATQQELLAEEVAYQDSPRAARDRDFFVQQLAGVENPASLSRRPAQGPGPTYRLEQRLAGRQWQALVARASRSACHPYSLLLAAVANYVQRMSGAGEVVLGIPLMGRLGSAAADTPCMKVNVVPLRIELSGTSRVGELLAQVERQFAALRRHQGCRQEWLQQRQPGQPLFGPQVNLMPFARTLSVGEGHNQVRGEVQVLAAGPVEECAFYFAEEAGATTLTLEVHQGRFSQQESERHLARLVAYLAAWSEAGDEALAVRLPLLLPCEQAELARWNQTDHPLPTTTLSALLAEGLAAADQSAIALECGAERWSVAELRQRTRQLASYLAGRGVGPGCRVAVVIPRAPELIFAQQAIMAVGAVYVPVDPDYPAERIGYILASSDPALVLTSHTLQMPLDVAAPLVCLDAPGVTEQLAAVELATTAPCELPAPKPEDAAYIIYTSGSTGRPKGVVVSHGAIVNRLLWMQHMYPIGPADRVLQKTPAGFDVSIWEFFWPFMTGARLVLAKPGGHKDPAYLAELIELAGITTLHFVPSMLQIFVTQAEPARCRALRQVFCSGEALPADLVLRWYGAFSTPLHNLYGPTEAAVDVTWYPCRADEAVTSVPIGYPVWNTSIHILDPWLQPVPPGVAGELWIGGVQVAEGYFGQPDLTAERFIANPFGAGRLYRSGDLAAWREDGAIEYLGRLDFQVKIRGQRIELEEIEQVLLRHPRVAQAVVLAPEFAPGDRRLVAYVVAADSTELTLAELAPALGAALPDYMVPGLLVTLAELPLTPNGKLDRKGLPLPDMASAVGQSLPKTLLEERLCRLFAEILGLARVGADDNFFALGGHSLLAAQLVVRIEESTGQALTLASLFEAPSPAQLARRLGGEREAMPMLLPLRAPGAQSGTSGPTLFCVHPAGGLGWCYAPLVPHLPGDMAVYALQARAICQPDAPLPASFDELALDYVTELRRQQSEGPYWLLGWSLGGMLVHRMAAMLQEQGQEVAMVLLLDAYPCLQWQTQPLPDEQRMLDALLRMGGIAVADEALDSLTRDAVVARLGAEGSALAMLDEQVVSAMIELVGHNNRLIRQPVDYCYHGEVIFIEASASRQPWLDGRGWESLTKGEIRYERFPCLHQEMVHPDWLAKIGALIGERVDGVGQQPHIRQEEDA